LNDLRRGEFDVLVGVNLLREGLDLPEVSLVAILDADKEGFLRSKTSLIQTIGRAARNVDSRVILYADKMTDSLKGALEETERRRTIQLAHNKKHSITPTSTTARLSDVKNEAGIEQAAAHLRESTTGIGFTEGSLDQHIAALKKQMLKAADDLEFEEAARLRDQLHKAEKLLMELPIGDGVYGKIEPQIKAPKKKRK
jgi:excinuclease ABC subunit B